MLPDVGEVVSVSEAIDLLTHPNGGENWAVFNVIFQEIVTMKSFVSSAIESLFDEYRGAPLRFLREINLQVRLGQLIEEELKSRNASLDTRATLTRGGNTVQVTTPVFRIQHEMKVAEGKEKSDIVVLKAEHHVSLSREKMGALDVVAAIPARDVEAVIEVKAACSADREQRHLFRKDVSKLHRLSLSATDGDFEMHFVLFDKSIPVGIDLLKDNPDPYMQWEKGDPYAVAYKGPNVPVIHASPQLDLSDQLPSSKSDQRLLHVWDMDRDGNLRHRVNKSPPRLRDKVKECQICWKTMKVPASKGDDGLWQTQRKD